MLRFATYKLFDEKKCTGMSSFHLSRLFRFPFIRFRLFFFPFLFLLLRILPFLCFRILQLIFFAFSSSIFHSSASLPLNLILLFLRFLILFLDPLLNFLLIIVFLLLPFLFFSVFCFFQLLSWPSIQCINKEGEGLQSCSVLNNEASMQGL